MYYCTHKCINSHYTIKLHGKQVLCLNEHILEVNVEMVQFVWILKGLNKRSNTQQLIEVLVYLVLESYIAS